MVEVDVEALRAQLADAAALRPTGRVLAVTGLTVRMALAGARLGDVVTLRRRGEPLLAEIVGFSGGEAVAVPFGELIGVGPDDPIESSGGPLALPVSNAMLGRVLDGFGRPLDGRPLPDTRTRVPADQQPPDPLSRPLITEALSTGVRAIDGFLTLGRGQRVGLFAGSGVGKSVLLGAIARYARADVVVVALVGERGREVREFIEHCLGPEGRERAVVVAATSDAPALERLKAAQVATAIAEHFRDAGKSVLLLVDSVTRVARAQREIGLAAGEPPARRGYPPSVFSLLPRLLERSGSGAVGAITAIYTVLVEGGDMEEPIADEVRGILDGHIVLSRELAARGHFPAIDVPASLSRVMPAVVSPEHLQAAANLRAAIGVYEQKRDLISLGAYEPGSDPAVDRAIALRGELDRLLQQGMAETSAFDESVATLLRLASR